MKIFFIFLATLLSFSSANVQAATFCACQTGSMPENQIGFFKAGCRIWLAAQKDCSESLMTSVQDGVDALPQSWNGGVVKLGYVGHWSAGLTPTFLRILEKYGVEDRNLSFEVDNTACSGMAYPEQVVKVMTELQVPQEKYIKFKASQVTSVGMWDGLLVGKSNLWAEIDSRTLSVTYPRCEEFERHACSDLGVGLQAGERGSCVTSEGTLRQIQCCNMTVETTKLSAKKNSEPQKVKVSSLMWATPEACLQGQY